MVQIKAVGKNPGRNERKCYLNEQHHGRTPDDWIGKNTQGVLKVLQLQIKREKIDNKD